jgi:PHS family inorganic phosphate transporter-like MFS transporter
MLTGIFSTLLIDETKGRTLEDLSNEDQEGFVRGMIYPSPLDAAHSVIYSLPIGVKELRVNKEGILEGHA